MSIFRVFKDQQINRIAIEIDLNRQNGDLGLEVTYLIAGRPYTRREFTAMSATHEAMTEFEDQIGLALR